MIYADIDDLQSIEVHNTKLSEKLPVGSVLLLAVYISESNL